MLTIITNLDKLKMMKPANKKQRQWMSDVAEWAENNIQTLYGDEWIGKPIQIHHVTGRSAKHNKVSIGHEFILPIPFDLHDVSSNHSFNVTHHKKAFVKEFGSQRSLFKKMVLDMKYNVPYIDILMAIDDTSA